MSDNRDFEVFLPAIDQFGIRRVNELLDTELITLDKLKEKHAGAPDAMYTLFFRFARKEVDRVKEAAKRARSDSTANEGGIDKRARLD